MSINRRDALKVAAIGVASAAATSLTGCNGSQTGVAANSQPSGKVLGKHQVVVIGGGFGGMTVANNLKQLDKNIDVLIIEKNDTYMVCPGSNTYLGKIKGMDLSKFIFDYNKAIDTYGYSKLTSEVVNIDRAAKEVHTAAGIVQYETLVLSPGIGYDYEGQFPQWSKEKIAKVKRNAPAAMIPGSEHITLERQLTSMDDGNFVICVPAGKYRCPPAPYERASMVAAYMKKENIKGKVIILNATQNIAKKAAFLESWEDLYGDNIQVIYDAKITDVDVDAKTVTYSAKDEMGDMASTTLDYKVLNLIPKNKGNSVVDMSGLETVPGNSHKVLMNGCSFRSKTDANVYVVGDVVGHAIPPSGQTAMWSGIECAKEIHGQITGKPYSLPVATETQIGANVCISMVGDNPEEGISVSHDFSFVDGVIKGKGHVPKGVNGKFRDEPTGIALRGWYDAVTTDLFT